MASSLSAADRRSHRREPQQADREVRRLLARELHDRVAQTLTGMLVDVENFKAEEVGWTDVVSQLNKIQGSTRQVLHSLRQLLHDLRGEDVIADDFVETVRGLVIRFSQQTLIAVVLNVSPRWPSQLVRPAYLNLYRIIEEALANVRMHSGASEAQIRLEPYSEHEVTIVISDDGRGLDTDQARPMGMGTLGMKERAALLGGELKIESKVGAGTTVRAIFPTALLIPREIPPSTEHLTQREVPA